MSRQPIRRPLEERFWEKVDKSGDCWVWTRSTNGSGYGQITMPRAGAPMLAHRVSWLLHYGPIPAGLFVCHRCDNPPCIRPEHLFLGTNRDNSRDMGAKGRAGATRHPERVPRGAEWYAVHPKPTHCVRGHLKTPTSRNKWNQCRACNLERWRLKSGYYERHPAA